MAIKNVWTIDGTSAISYRMHYDAFCLATDSINSLHREIVFLFGGSPLDVSLSSMNTLGVDLSASQQRLDDRTVVDVCSELLHGQRVEDESSDFAKTAAIVFDWVYIQAVLQRFQGVPDLSHFDFFTDIKIRENAAYSGARAVAVLKLLVETGNLDIVDNFERFSAWHVDAVAEPVDAPEIFNDYHIVKQMSDHVSVISRLPKNIMLAVSDKMQSNLWDDIGRYIFYSGEFRTSWVHDFDELCYAKEVLGHEITSF